MWSVIQFKFNGDIESARDRRDAWLNRNCSRYQIREIFVDNAFAFEYRPFRNLDVACIGNGLYCRTRGGR